MTNIVGTDKTGELNRAEENVYDPFGKAEEGQAESKIENEIKYTGAVLDNSGVYYLSARHYDANTGRFLQQDTYKGDPYSPWTQNLYAYTGNNPTNYVDPTGHSFLAVLGVIIFAGIVCVGCGGDTAAPPPSPITTTPPSPKAEFADEEEEKITDEVIQKAKKQSRTSKHEVGYIIYRVNGKYEYLEVGNTGKQTVSWRDTVDKIEKELGGEVVSAVHTHPYPSFKMQNFGQGKLGTLSSEQDFWAASRKEYKFTKLYKVCGDYQEYIDAASLREKYADLQSSDMQMTHGSAPTPAPYYPNYVKGKNYEYADGELRLK